MRLNDEETSVRDLVEKILIELYLPLVIANADWVDLSKDFKAGYSRKLLLLCHAETSQKGMATLFYNFLAATKSNGHKVGEIMVRTLMNCISLAGTDGDNLLIEACLSLLYQVSRVYTSAFVSHVSSIHSLIDFNAIDPTSMLILNHAVLIIREVVEKSKNLNAISMKAIQMDLQKVLEKGSQPVLKASIPCLCSVVQYQTKSSEFLVQIVQRCYMMLAKFKKSLEGGSRIPDNALRTCYRALLILVPVVSFFDFESEFRISSAEYSNLVLQHLSGGSRILDLVFELAIVFTNSFLRFEAGQIGISAIGNLFVRHPEYMIQKKSLDLMNFVFSSSNLLYHYELLQVYLNYLELQQNLNSLSTDIPPALDIDVLVGNADVLLSEGIPTAVMQTFLPNILADMLVVDFNVSLTAFKIVSTALENGLVHPIQCVPAICAMESNPEDFLAQQALGIHRKLHEKHPSFIHSKIVESVNCVYRYQKTLTSAKGVPLLGFRNENALVNPMYSLIRLQKGRRNQFLKTLVYFFDIPKGTDSIMSLDYYHFIAENLAYLDFKTQEEALHVVYFINLILSVSGESLRLTLDGYGENETPADGN